ncbi:MAG TPA: DUF1207 domain-containing protein [Magnetospirillum sp.]|nr:DUF1207 domain-containing protein [Magnetospirillum sp.]
MRRSILAFAVALGVGTVAQGAELPEKPEVLPRGKLFDPLLADPRWPHFSASVQDYGGNNGLNTVASVSVGDEFSLYQAPISFGDGNGGAWGIGVQAAVFALFDLDAQSKDLINADYWVGIPLSWRSGPNSAILRVYHQSSHLGDEYLLRSAGNSRSRINLSYEVVDFKLSRDFYGRTLRLYGGAGLLFDQEPADIKRGLVQWGAELRSPWSFADGLLRPVAAADFQSTEESGWQVDVSTRAGLELASSVDRDYVVQLMLEYYHGRNPNGQFFLRDVEFYGVGLHAYF